MAEEGMQKILERAREMQKKQHRRLRETTVESSVADGKLQGTMNGHRALISLGIDPELADPAQRTSLERAVVELVNDLVTKTDEVLSKRFGLVDKMPSLSIENLFRRS